MWGHYRCGGRPGASVGARLADFEDWLDRQLDLVQPSRIFYEAPYLAGAGKINPATILVLYSLQGFLLAAAHRRDIAIEKVNISTITKTFTGFSWGRLGRAEKKAATIRMCQIYGWDVASDDEADALAIFVYGENTVDPVAARNRSAGPLWATAAREREPTG